MKVIIDILGGDLAPDATLGGAILALKKNPKLEFVLVGDKSVIEPRMKAAGMENRIEIVHATETIPYDEQPTTAIKQRPNSSIVRGITVLKERDDCGAFVSAGSTGAVLTGGFLKIGRIEGVSRPALCPLLHTKTGGRVMIIDAGANMDSKPINLVQFAIMASIYRSAEGIPNPRVALVNVGTEDSKGNDLTKAAFEMLQKIKGPNFNFVGNMEAKNLFSGEYDIVVCDGFVGNVLLKTAEGSFATLMSFIKKCMRGIGGTIGKLFMARKLLGLKYQLSQDNIGGSPFLGLKKPLIKAHGDSGPMAFYNAILVAAAAAEMDLGEKIKNAIAAADKIIGEN